MQSEEEIKSIPSDSIASLTIENDTVKTEQDGQNDELKEIGPENQQTTTSPTTLDNDASPTLDCEPGNCEVDLPVDPLDHALATSNLEVQPSQLQDDAKNGLPPAVPTSISSPKQPTDEKPIRPKQVRFAEKSEVPYSLVFRRNSSMKLSLPQRGFFRRKVVLPTIPIPDDEIMAFELARTAAVEIPILTMKNQITLGVRWSKQVKLMRLNSNGSPKLLKLSSKRKPTIKQWTLVGSHGLAMNSTLIQIAVDSINMGNEMAIVLFQALRSNPNIMHLSISSNKIGDDAMFALSALLQTNSSLTELNAHHNCISARGIKYLALALQENQDSMLIDLDLSFNPLTEASTDALATCLQINETLTNLNLAGTSVFEAGILQSLRRNYTLLTLQLQTIVSSEPDNQSGRLSRDRLNRSHAPPLMDALRRSTGTLESCNLTGFPLPIHKLKTSRWIKYPNTSLNELDGMIISALLPVNKNLMELDLSSNNLRSESVVAIVAAIIECPALTTVDIHDNDLTEVIGEALGLALVNNATLQTIRVAECTLDIQQLRGNETSDELLFPKDAFVHPLDNWIVTVLMSVNRATSNLNGLHVSSHESHLDMCHISLQTYEAVYISTRVRHHVHMTHLFINCSHLNYYAGIRLADAIRNHPILQTVSFEHNNLHQAGGRAIAECMEHNRTITSLNLSWNHLDDNGVLPFATSLLANRSLKRLDLRGNEIGAKGIAAISSGLAGNACLQELHLRWNDIGTSAAESLARALTINKHLKLLDINQHHMELPGAIAIANMLRLNKSLTSLIMNGDSKQYPTSSIGPKGAREIALAFKESNQTLLDLSIAENRFQLEGCEHIVEIAATSKLQKLDLSHSMLDGETSLVLFSHLAHNKTIIELNLAHNTVGADGIKGCVRSLCVNKTLRELNLTSNRITEEGMLLIESNAKNFSLSRLRLLENRVTDGTRDRLQSLELLIIDI